MSKRFILIAGALMLTACSQGGHQDLVAYTEQVRSSSVPAAEPIPELPELRHVAYNGQDFRNPFEPASLSAPEPGGTNESCPQPNLDRKRAQLESLGLDQLNLVGTMQTNSDGQVALISTNQGRLYRVTMGDYLGLNLGQVVEITSTYISIAEWVSDGEGCWQRRNTALHLPSSQGSSEL